MAHCGTHEDRVCGARALSEYRRGSAGMLHVMVCFNLLVRISHHWRTRALAHSLSLCLSGHCENHAVRQARMLARSILTTATKGTRGYWQVAASAVRSVAATCTL